MIHDLKNKKEIAGGKQQNVLINSAYLTFVRVIIKQFRIRKRKKTYLLRVLNCEII